MSFAQHLRAPAEGECAPYYRTYIDQVPEGDYFALSRQQLDGTCQLLENLSPDKQAFRYAPDKWSVKQVLGHILDTEWVFSYRALCMARGDTTPLPGMDQDHFTAGANHDERSMDSLLSELKHLRTANLSLFESFDDAILDRTGNASGVDFTVRSLLYIIAGHERHHVRVLRDKYQL